ncbi:hypothetical protein [Aestuariivivens sediminis]|nr:hypothetical protein [Aestuariivivens sediminis]
MTTPGGLIFKKERILSQDWTEFNPLYDYCDDHVDDFYAISDYLVH